VRFVQRFLLGGAAAAVLGLCTATFLLYRRVEAVSEVDTARQSAVDAARTRLPQLLSYDYHTLDKDLAGARAGTTGAFRDQFAELSTKVVAPAAQKQQIVTKTTATGTSVVSAEPDRVVLLVFLDQVTQTGADPSSRIDGARVRATLQRQDGQWLVSDLAPV
jgi:Mce-associated membrane protein